MIRLLDPMKANDLKREVNWLSEKPFASIERFLDPYTHVIEPKFDGVRAMLVIGEEENTLYYGHSARKGPKLAQLQGGHRLAGTILDGEVLDLHGSLGDVVGILNSTNPNLAKLARLGFVAFDMLSVSGTQATDNPWRERRAVLEASMEHLPEGVHLCPAFPASPQAAESVMTAGFEGFMLKSREGKYRPGKRTDAWRKVKKMRTADCFVVGFEPGRGGYEGLVGSLRMAVYDGEGNEVEVCKHGVFDEKFRRELTADDGSLKNEFYGAVMEVMYQEVTKDLRLRHPHLYRVRPDKEPEHCTIDQLNK